jgi:hypothetical protein
MGLWVARLKDGGWMKESLALTGTAVAAAVIASDLHLLYRDDAGLRYVRRRGRSLDAPELVDASDGSEGELVVDAAGTVHALYHALGLELRHAVRREQWSTEVVDTRFSDNVSLALGRDGTVFAGYRYVSFQDDHGCVLASQTGSGWSHRDLSRVDDHYSSSACTCRLAPDGTVHIAFDAYRPEGLVLRHGFGSFASLRFETVDKVASFGVDPGSAAVDSTGALHALYRGDGPESSPLRVALLRVGMPDVHDTVPPATSAGGVRAAIDGAGVTHAVYYQDGRLMYAGRGPY